MQRGGGDHVGGERQQPRIRHHRQQAEEEGEGDQRREATRHAEQRAQR